MKMFFVVSALIMSVSASVAMADQYTGGPCSVRKLMDAIHRACGDQVEWTNGEIAYFGGEMTDTYQVPVTTSDRDITVRTDSGSCTSLDVRSACRNN